MKPGNTFCRFSLCLLLTLPLSAEATATAAAPTKNSRPVFLADVPLHVRSWEKEGFLGAEVAGHLDYPLPTVRETLTRPEAWCEFLPLVFNIKSCTYARTAGGERLTVYVGRKFYETPEEAYQLDYRFQIQAAEDDRFQVLLLAPAGPHGTGDYRITVEARSEAGGGTALRMHSSFRSSLRSRLATQAYLSTSGRDKIGFSVKGRVNGEPVYVDGTHGIVERNAMRYYLALKAHLDTLVVPEKKRFEARLATWFAMTEKYRRQLFEMSKEEYLAGKRQERQEQLALQKGVARRAG